MGSLFWRVSIGLSLLMAIGCKDKAICGDLILQAGEACEDGNTANGDGCSSECQVEPGAENCGNGIDDDGDGLVDCDDDGCDNNIACFQPENCANGADDDNDGFADCADPDCANNVSCQANDALVGEPCTAAAQCADNFCLDEPNDGFPSGYCSENCNLAAGTCAQAQGASCIDVGLGNGTGFCLDECNPAGNDCRNGYDCFDVGGGLGVCFPACTADVECPATDNCSAEIGFCTPPELCSGGVDEDFDDAVDCLDQDCQGNAACQGSPEVCTNGIDDDFNGQTDCADAACVNNAACQGAGTLNVLNLGAVPTGQSRTFAIPAGALGFTILVEGDVGNTYAVERLVKPNGTVLITGFNSSSVFQFPSEQAFGLVMPPNDIAVNAVTSGSWQVTIGSDFADSPNVSVLVREGPFASGLHDVKIYIPTGLAACDDANCPQTGNGVVVTAANANTILEIQGMLNTYFSEFYSDEGGLSQGNVQFFNINNSAFLDIGSQTELDNLFRQSSIGGAGGMHFFLVQSFSGEFAGGVAGIASGIPGAMTSANNRNAGVAVSIQADVDQNLNFTGLTMAHEGGHFMGLFHTTEFNGQADDISDTPACPSATIQNGNLGACPDLSFMMFPSLAPQMQNISNTQADVIQAGPLYR